MFMFWSKRAVLTRRLLKAKVRGEHETECETQEDTLSRINVPKNTNNVTQSQQQRNTSTRTERNSNNSAAGGEVSHTTRAQKSTLTSSPSSSTSSPCSNSNSSSSSNSSASSSSCFTSGNNRPSNSVATRFHQGCCGGEISHDEDDDDIRHQDNHNNQRNNVVPNRLTRCKELLKSLKEHQLEMLLNVVESYGADFGSCVLVPRKQPQQQQQPSPKRFTTSFESPTTNLPSSLKLKQPISPTCNRHSRSPLSPSASCSSPSCNLHETTTTSRRLNPHRHILRSRRHNPSTRCSRCPNNHPANTIATTDEFSSPSIRTGNHGDKDEHPPFLSNDNQTNLRFIDRSTNLPIVDDLRQQQPAWTADSETNRDIDTLNKIETPSLDLNDINNDIAASRPERDRCRHTKISRSNVTRKRRESPISGTQQHHHDHCNNSDTPPDDPHLLSCQTWRWPDLANSAELKKLPVCHSAKDPVYVCCNPYHWSRLCKPESPPPPYCLIPDRLRPEDRAPSEISSDYRRCGIGTSPQPHSGSLTTNGEGGSEMGQKEWCTLAYWELGGRVGRLYPVEPLTVNVFDSLHDGDGLCLATLAENHVASPAVQRTRSKIGLGLMLSQESDGVWAYNRSESPIFVNSPTLDDPESRTLLVYRVPPGFCLNIFDRSKTMKLPRCIGQSSSISGSFNSGPVDVNSVRISFAKGWGPKYSRQEVTSCPCWLEVLLAPCR